MIDKTVINMLGRVYGSGCMKLIVVGQHDKLHVIVKLLNMPNFISCSRPDLGKGYAVYNIKHVKELQEVLDHDIQIDIMDIIKMHLSIEQ